ncbi:hypothetical protein [Desulfonema magnum]|uniref:Uncharacterized protein n=1 Tax=Desulfonema magnum TaxID=45655 RepID=A0A975BPC6_9BACT|nr:hypothetical protein [Desulfonema magnum]QTA89183.1 Uncharacterized protein dnm_052330 [Desulfonema magnum]
MAEERKTKGILSDNIFKIIITSAIIITAIVAGLWFWWKQRPEPVTKDIPEKKTGTVSRKVAEKAPEPSESQPVIDYDKLENDSEFKDMMADRKEEYGVDKGVDMIVKSDESVKIADTTIPMREILDKIRLKEGGLIEDDLTGKPKSENDKGQEATGFKKASDAPLKMSITPDQNVKVYGIHVVRPGDNIWNIHFEFLKHYFEKRGVTVSPRADEPTLGRSSGVGKLLKFSEKMVYIYNLKERKLDVDLHLIHPLSKIVVFNLGQAFSLLNQIDYKNVSRIQFDGETIWIPAEQ